MRRRKGGASAPPATPTEASMDDEAAKAEAAKVAAELAEADELAGLVAMTKGGETIRVHPTCADDHKRAGWVVA